ncbi:hypothetical protein BDW68DRAFT_169244 [Aspergillus falconensis]
MPGRAMHRAQSIHSLPPYKALRSHSSSITKASDSRLCKVRARLCQRLFISIMAWIRSIHD